MNSTQSSTPNYILTVTVTTTVFWDKTPNNLVNVSQKLQNPSLGFFRYPEASQPTPPKRWQFSTTLHGIIFTKVVLVEMVNRGYWAFAHSRRLPTAALRVVCVSESFTYTPTSALVYTLPPPSLHYTLTTTSPTTLSQLTKVGHGVFELVRRDRSFEMFCSEECRYFPSPHTNLYDFQIKTYSFLTL